MTDPLSLTVGTIALMGAGATAVDVTHKLLSDYRDARLQMLHARDQHVLLQGNVQLAKANTSPQCPYTITSSQSLLERIEKDFPSDIRLDRRRDRLLWAFKDKKKVRENLDRQMKAEISSVLSLQLHQSLCLGEIQSMFTAQKTTRELELAREVNDLKIALEVKEKEFQKTLQPIQSNIDRNGAQYAEVLTLLRYLTFNNPSSQTVYSSAQRRNPVAQQWNPVVIRYLGIQVCLITSEIGGEARHRIFIRCPLIGPKALNGRISASWRSWFTPSFHPCFRVQNIIPESSDIVEACRVGDISTMRELFLSGGAHPNDTTSENLTLLYLAIQSDSAETVQLLLDSGADPNLTFGSRWETSPLNSGFLHGNEGIIRLLLKAQADLHYVNRRLWASPRYLFDPDPKFSKSDASVLLEICHTAGFDDWDSTDLAGWTIVHRAAAFGQASDITRLLYLGASADMEIPTMKWKPIQCAANFGNLSTCTALADSIAGQALVNLTDSRGWTVLHLAAQRRSLALLVDLLKRGLRPLQKSSPSCLLVPQGLERVEATPRDVAKACGNEDIYLQALEEAGVEG